MKRLNEVLSDDIIQEQLDSGYHITICPVCGNETFDDYFICPHCGWEHDGTIDSGQFSSANKSSINDYKKFLQNHCF